MRRAIYGGTFDPPHQGHLALSLQIQKHFSFDAYHFLPCKIPVHKKASTANTEERIAMLSLLLNEDPNFILDLREVKRASPSYMIETLKSLKDEFQNDELTLILGEDSFQSIQNWEGWEAFLSLSHILILERKAQKDNVLKESIENFLKGQKAPCYTITVFNAGHYPISSTEVREQLVLGQDCQALLPKAIFNYIKANKLYSKGDDKAS